MGGTFLVALCSFVFAIVTSNRDYSASFFLKDAIPGNVWIQWTVDPGYDTYTGWFYIGPLDAGYHSVTFEATDIGEVAVRFYLGMYGTGQTIDAMIAPLTTMDGATSSYQYTGSNYTWSCAVSTSDCCICAFNTLYDGFATFAATTLGCNDAISFESNRNMNPTVEPTTQPSDHPSVSPSKCYLSFCVLHLQMSRFFII